MKRLALCRLRCYPLLQGFRGKPAADIDTVVGSIRAIVDLAEARHESLLEMDINPLLVTPERCVAVDVMLHEIVSSS